MTKEELIRNLKYTMEKHKNDKVDTFGTNISFMCKDVLDYLEQPTTKDCLVVEDCVSRQAAKIDVIPNSLYTSEQVIALLDNLSPVTPTFPKGVTNGDMIKAMFPDIKIHEHEKTDICDAHIQIDIWDFSIYVSKDWWNAPYTEKRGNEND